MAIKVYGLAMSTCTKRVLTTLKEKQVEYELVEIDFMNQEHKSEKYLEKQPFGMIPYLDDDGFIVYESRAICRYLEAKFKDQGTQLVPKDAKELALFEQGASIETSYFDTFASPIAFEKVFKAWKGLGEADEVTVKALVDKANQYLDVYEKILSKQEYIGGNTFTLADIYHLPYGSMLFLPNVGYGSLIEDRPHVKAWWDKITSRSSWQQVNQ